MTNNNAENSYYDVVIYNDDKKPFSFVAGLIGHITGLALYECEELARRIGGGSRSIPSKGTTTDE